jgi:hypothetical protein
MASPGSGTDDDNDDKPTVRNWWDYGCLQYCRGRAEQVPTNKGCGKANPDIVFNCAGCNHLFHADCVGASVEEKARIKNFAKAQQRRKAERAEAARAGRAVDDASPEHVAVCPTCLLQCSSVWRTCQSDTTVVSLILNSAEKKKLLKPALRNVCTSAEPPLDLDLAWSYSNEFHSAEPRSTKLLSLM